MKRENSTAPAAVPEIKERYHFAGQGIYKPATIEAASYEEALAMWESEREKLTN